MANRVLVGKRGTSDFGVFVSQNGVDVANTSITTPLAFDSRAVRGLVIHSKGEGSLAPNPVNDGDAHDYPTSVSISHTLGYVPLYVVRWCYASDLTSGVADRMYTPSHARNNNVGYDLIEEVESQWDDISVMGVSTEMSTTALTIKNHEYGHSTVVGDDEAGTAPAESFGENSQTIYYAYIIFKAKDFTGGLGL